MGTIRGEAELCSRTNTRTNSRNLTSLQLLHTETHRASVLHYKTICNEHTHTGMSCLDLKVCVCEAKPICCKILQLDIPKNCLPKQVFTSATLQARVFGREPFEAKPSCVLARIPEPTIMCAIV